MNQNFAGLPGFLPAGREFFQGETVSIAQKLLGCVLARPLEGGLVSAAGRGSGGGAGGSGSGGATEGGQTGAVLTDGGFGAAEKGCAGGSKLLAGKIVETEAYLGLQDKCCHSFKGRRTARTETMYLPAGHAYIYFIYGSHYCFNIVTGNEKEPEAVLIRALEPLRGKRRMSENRSRSRRKQAAGDPASDKSVRNKARRSRAVRNGARRRDSIFRGASLRDLSPSAVSPVFLSSGPGRLCQAFEITSDLNGAPLFSPSAKSLFILKEERPKNFEMDSDFRVGLPLSNDHAFLPLRFYIRDNPFVSKKPLF